MSLTISDIVGLFESKGHAQYDGEPVTQLEHALQTASLAQDDGAAPALVTAAFLHDLGHLLHDFGKTPTQQGLDDLHQYRCLPFLRALFGPQTLEPIRLHVDAKRFLCAARPGYYEALSADSKRSLALQGGVFSPSDADAFIRLPYAADAVRLRVWDDRAKRAGASTPTLDHFLDVAQRVTA